MHLGRLHHFIWWFEVSLPRRVTSSPLKIEFLHKETLILWGPPPLNTFSTICQLSSWVTIIYSCFHGPHWAYLRGSVIESRLFRASVMSHPYILGVYFMSHHTMSQYSIHIFISFILCCPFLASSRTIPIPSDVDSVASRSTMRFMLWQR